MTIETPAIPGLPASNIADLREFVLARIADREAMYAVPEFVLVDSAHGTGWGSRGDCTICDAYMPQGLEDVTGEGYYEHLEHAHQRALVLAECEAKRRIVDIAAELHGVTLRGRSVQAMILGALAQVHAGHPDFDESWRV